MVLGVVCIMNRLAIHGINLEVSASEFERSITRSLSAGSIIILSVRNDLFTEAMEAGLASVGDALVKRRKMNCGKTVKQKHVSDLWQLVCSILRTRRQYRERSLETGNDPRIS